MNSSFVQKGRCAEDAVQVFPLCVLLGHCAPGLSRKHRGAGKVGSGLAESVGEMHVSCLCRECVTGDHCLVGRFLFVDTDAECVCFRARAHPNLRVWEFALVRRYCGAALLSAMRDQS